MVQADSQHRQRPEDITNLRVRNGSGEMVPIGSVATVTQTFGPDPVMRYNNYPAADLIGDADPRVLSSGRVVEKLTEISKKVLPPGMVLEWTDLTYQQTNQSGAAAVRLPIGDPSLCSSVLAAL